MSDADILIVASLMAVAFGLGWYASGALPLGLVAAGVVGFLLGVFGVMAEQRNQGGDQ